MLRKELQDGMKKIDKILRRNSTSSIVDNPETHGSEEDSEG